VHPITILSTLPSAGVGAALALMVAAESKTWFMTPVTAEFNIMALIGVILLIGIVKKNAIMMIDFALEAERNQGLDSREAIYRASLLRFRPIMMTTMAALLGALPLAIGFGEGSELRRPLGISIVGGLMVSQMLTLFTTPVIYLYLDRFALWLKKYSMRQPPAYIVSHWRGELSIARSFGLNLLLRFMFDLLWGIVVLIVVYVAGMSDELKFGTLAFTKNAPPFLVFISLIGTTVIVTWWSVGVWRSCDRHYKPDKKLIYWFIKIIIVLNMIGVVAQIGILGSRVAAQLSGSDYASATPT